MDDSLDRHDPNYNYKKRSSTISNSFGYPIIEKTYNALLFPEGPKDDIDLREFEPED